MNKILSLIITLILIIISTMLVSAENVTLQKTIVTPSVDNVTINDTIQFLINLTNNNATDNITNMTINDIYNYSHLVYVGSTVAPYQNSSGQITWNVTNLGNLSSYLIEVNFTALTNVSDTNNTASLINISASELANSTILFNISEMPDTTNPNITLNVPNDNENRTNFTTTFNATVSDNKNISNVTLYGNWSGSWVANETNSTLTNNWDYLFELPLANGTYIWNVYVCDGSGNCAFASNNYTLNVDTRNVNLTVNSPGTGPYNTKEVLINLSIPTGFANQIWWNAGSSNTTYTSTLTYNFSEGWNTFTAYVNDSLNTVVTATKRFYVKLTTPVVNQVVPVNNKETTSNLITFRANVTEREYAMDACKLYVDGSLKGTNVTPERNSTNFSVNFLGDNNLAFDTRIDDNDLPSIFASTRTFTHNNTAYTYTEYLSIEQGALYFNPSFGEEDFTDKIYLSVDSSKIKHIMEINESFNWSKVNATMPISLIILGDTLNITSIDATNITVYTNSLSEIYKDGDSAEIFAEPANEDDADWLWDINMTANGTLNYVGLTNNIDRIDLDCNQEDERCALRPRHVIALPNDYAGIFYESVSEERNAYTTIQIEADDGSIDLNDESGNNRSDLAGVIFTTDSSNKDFVVGLNTSSIIYVVDNNSVTEIWFRNGSTEYLTNATNFSIKTHNESIIVTIPQGPLTTNVNENNESQAFNIEFPGSGDGLWFFVDVDNDFFGENTSEEEKELRYSTINTFGTSLGVGARDWDQTFYYGAIVEQPDVTFGSGSTFDLEIPSQRVYADIIVAEMTPDISYASTSLTNGDYEWYIECNNTQGGITNSTTYNLDIVDDDDDSSSSNSPSSSPSSSISSNNNNDDDDDDDNDKADAKPKAPEVETPDPTEKKSSKVKPTFDINYENNTELMTAMKKILGEEYLDEEKIAKFKEFSEKLNETIEINRDIETGTGTTKVILSIQNKGEFAIRNLAIHDIIPKEFAELAKDVIVEAKGAKIEVVKEDPELLLMFSEVKPNDLVTVEYKLSEDKDKEVLDSFSTNVYAEEIELEVEEEVKSQKLTLTFIIIVVLSLIIAVIVLYLFHKNKDHKGSNGKKPITSGETQSVPEAIQTFMKK